MAALQAAADASEAAAPPRFEPADAETPCGVATLSADLLCRVLALLPADARARCGTVCRALCWHALRGPDAWRLWTALDLSPSSGVTCHACHGEYCGTLVGAAALARGRLLTLVTPSAYWQGDTDVALCGVLRGSPALLELTLDWRSTSGLRTLEQLVRAAAPTLQQITLKGLVQCGADDVGKLLRREAPYAAVRVQRLQVNRQRGEAELGLVSAMRPFAAAVVAHASLRELTLSLLTWAELAALETLVDAALAVRLRRLHLEHCDGLTPAFLPPLARLLAAPGSALEALDVSHCALLAGASVADVIPLCDTLQRSATLTRVTFEDAGLNLAQEDAQAHVREAFARRRPPGQPRADTVQAYERYYNDLVPELNAQWRWQQDVVVQVV